MGLCPAPHFTSSPLTNCILITQTSLVRLRHAGISLAQGFALTNLSGTFFLPAHLSHDCLSLLISPLLRKVSPEYPSTAYPPPKSITLSLFFSAICMYIITDLSAHCLSYPQECKLRQRQICFYLLLSSQWNIGDLLNESINE